MQAALLRLQPAAVAVNDEAAEKHMRLCWWQLLLQLLLEPCTELLLLMLERAA